MVLVMISNVKTFICLFFLTLSFPLSASTFEFTKWKIGKQPRPKVVYSSKKYVILMKIFLF